jgi:hypothetical protein
VGFLKRVIVMLGMLHVRGVVHHLVYFLIGRMFMVKVSPVRGMVHGLMLEFFLLMFAMLLGPVFPVFFTHRPNSFLVP